MGKIFYVLFLLLCFTWKIFCVEEYIERFHNMLDKNVFMNHLLLLKYTAKNSRYPFPICNQNFTSL